MAQIKGGEEGGEGWCRATGGFIPIIPIFCFFLGRGGCVLRKLGDQL